MGDVLVETSGESRLVIPLVKRVLVVDDSRSQRRLLSVYLNRWGYQVVEASSGAEALELCKMQSFDLILSDWMMPGMNGLEFCITFRNLKSDRYTYFILLTSKSEKGEVAHGLDIGADDFLTKPVAALELKARIKAGERILNMERELTEKNRLVSETLTEISDLYESLDRDLLEARSLQQSLVREKFRDFGTAQVSLLLRSSGHIGGDLVGFFGISDTQIGLYSIDVSGHGMASALMTARLAAYLSGSSVGQNMALCKDDNGTVIPCSPADVARQINQLILEEMETEIYFTMMLGYFDTQSGIAKLVQCGHPNAAIQRSDGNTDFFGDGGLPVGLIAAANWSDFEVQLQPGDRLFLSSDGIIECPGKQNDYLDEQGLAKLMFKNSDKRGDQFFKALMSDLTDFSGVENFPDDVSAVLLEYVHVA